MVILEIPSNRYKIRVKTDNSATIFDLVPLSFILLKEQSAEIIRNFTCDCLYDIFDLRQVSPCWL